MQEPTHSSVLPCKTQDLLDRLLTQNKNRNGSRTLTGTKACQFDIHFPAANDFSSLKRGHVLNRGRQKGRSLQATATATLHHTRSYHCLWVTHPLKVCSPPPDPGMSPPSSDTSTGDTGTACPTSAEGMEDALKEWYLSVTGYCLASTSSPALISDAKEEELNW